ncbi:flagellar basal-body MS-ring/collar protein FliF [Aliidiomarina haloalkalitolerans]|uniref:Flagellar M-ring protein n=1 Tax=Aliidiomarina haloalkalitolerans TaxID=859059 RepID=A0A432VSA4_9GAMM|nr:flagellar basal-body MS-ring/collar protein FliF [Aliidiomarina haloalkalitolerans]RUO19239.1 flagellar basal body M-ring protein FliF [Aliidiomarina haloalkalitolerans]
MDTTVNQQAQPAAASSANPAFDKAKAMLRGNSMLPILIGGAAFIAVVVALIMWATTPEYRVLYSNLSEADGGRIVSELETQRIPYQLTAGGSTIMIPGNQVHRVRLSMAEQGIPAGGNVGFSLMDNQAFGISQFAEQVNFQRALEGELASSMESLGPVHRARVHLAMAKPSVFVREREPAKASVVLSLHAGRVLGDGQVMAIVHMVASSVPELTADNVTVVDQHGNLLSSNGQKSDLTGTELTYTQEVERAYQRRIEDILAPILGRENVRAQVVAQIDFSRVEETSERYTPNQNPENAAVRSIQSNLSYQRNGENTGGVPGALSNTPPGVVTAPIELEAGAEGNGEAAGQPSNVRQDNIVNYEVDRSIAHIQHQRGRLERLSAAVVVNYRNGFNEEGESIQVPLSPEEIDRIDRLVRQAMGYSDGRGDQLEIVNSAFVEQHSPLFVQREWWQEPEMQALLMQASRYVLAGLGILLFYLLILRPMLRKRFGTATAKKGSDAGDDAEMDETEALTAKRGKLRAIVGDDDDAEDAKAKDEDIEEMTFNWPKKKDTSAYEAALKKTQEVARQKPRQVARIVQNWLAEDEHVRD